MGEGISLKIMKFNLCKVYNFNLFYLNFILLKINMNFLLQIQIENTIPKYVLLYFLKQNVIL